MNKYFIGTETYKGFNTCTLTEAYDYLSKQSVISIDIETSRKFEKNKFISKKYQPGLDPYLSKVIMLQIGTLDTAYIIDTRFVDISILLPLLENPNILKVGANLTFEYIHFKVSYGIEINNMYDVLLVDKLLTNGLYNSYSLMSLAIRYLGLEKRKDEDLFGGNKLQKEINSKLKELIDEYLLFNDYITEETEDELRLEATEQVEANYIDKGIRLEFLNIGNKLFKYEHITYGLNDIIYPLQLRDLFLKGRKVIKSVDKNNIEYEIYYPVKAISQEMALIPVLGSMKLDGVVITQDLWDKLGNTKLEEYYKQVERLNEYVINFHSDFCLSPDLFSNKPTCAIKWSSSKQVIQLFDKLNLTAIEYSKTTKKEEKTIGAKALLKALPNEMKSRCMEIVFPEKIETPNEVCLQYLLLKKLQQLTTTYGKDFLDYVHPITGKIHCNFRQFLNTGRMAATSPNVLALPRSQEYRDCFTAPDGYVVAACDFSS